jgi:hypothetical protein
MSADDFESIDKLLQKCRALTTECARQKEGGVSLTNHSEACRQLSLSLAKRCNRLDEKAHATIARIDERLGRLDQLESRITQIQRRSSHPNNP